MSVADRRVQLAQTNCTPVSMSRVNLALRLTCGYGTKSFRRVSVIATSARPSNGITHAK